uniref:WGS project CBMG000000000 data, contig CS5907-c000470 n=1 Tax=Fusarium acuminatum CS5907 TaxID=1318461 RepID=A0A096PDZ7_9HYPO|nr:unnamed protein product [Fusarium acuminatum CS5907]
MSAVVVPYREQAEPSYIHPASADEIVEPVFSLPNANGMVQNYDGLGYEQWWTAGQPLYLPPSETPSTSFHISDVSKVQDLVSSYAKDVSFAEYTPTFTQDSINSLPRSNSTFPGESPLISPTSNIGKRKQNLNTIGYSAAGTPSHDPHKTEVVSVQDRAGKDRRETRAKSRLAASKHRNKNRENIKRLQLYEESLECTNRYMLSCVRELALEACSLKAMLLQHSECGCSTIKSYLVTEANRFVSELESNQK